MAGSRFDGFVRNLGREAGTRRVLLTALFVTAMGSAAPAVEEAMARVQCRKGHRRCHG